MFARLRLPADGGKAVKDHGVHAFICRIRNDNGTLCKGVEVRDCGYKVGLNGIDNGAIAFHDVRIPRENLLDKFASVRFPPATLPCLRPPAAAPCAPAVARHPHRLSTWRPTILFKRSCRRAMRAPWLAPALVQTSSISTRSRWHQATGPALQWKQPHDCRQPTGQGTHSARVIHRTHAATVSGLRAAQGCSSCTGRPLEQPQWR